MFENIYVDALESKSLNKKVKLNLLLLKYVELRKLQQLHTSDEFSRQEKRTLQRNKVVKQAAKKLIRESITKKLKPEETYEVWHAASHLNRNLERQRPLASVHEVLEAHKQGQLKKSEEDYEDGQQVKSEQLEQELKKFTVSFDSSSSWTKASVLIRTSGLETLPESAVASTASSYSSNSPSTYGMYGTSGNGGSHSGSASGIEGMQKGTVGFNRYHVTNLRNLIHLNMLRRNWEMAYKVFCLLIRLPHVDIRSIWPLGVEILVQVQAQVQAQAQAQAAQSGTSMDTETPQLFKEDRFFEWLRSFFIIARSTTRNSRLIAAPVWRSGSKTHAPLYVITSLWKLIVKKETTKVVDTIEELLLEPPYNTEGVFYFLLAMCRLSACYGEIVSKETVVQNIAAAERDLAKCKELHFVYPKELVARELKLAFSKSEPANFGDGFWGRSTAEVEEKDEDEDIEDNDNDDNDNDDNHDTVINRKLHHFAYEVEEYYGEQAYTGDLVDGNLTQQEDDPNEAPANKDISMDFDFDFE